jgi:linoleoyl-CoA desaturase
LERPFVIKVISLPIKHHDFVQIPRVDSLAIFPAISAVQNRKMGETTFQAVRFVAKDDKGFGNTVKKRVSEYFKTKNIRKTGDYRLWIKAIVLPVIYITPFVLILTNMASSSLLLFYALWIIMGIGLAGCGLGIMHDACHGAFSSKAWINNFIGKFILFLAGGYALNWKIQHNVLHHSYTNINGYDEDIDPAGVMRFSPHQPTKKVFKYQIYYAWFLYGLMTFSWVTFKDFVGLYRYHQKGLLQTQGTTLRKEIPKLIVSRVVYYGIFIALPLVFVDVGWWHILLGWFCMHFVGGLTLACIFQPAHVMPTSEYPLPDKDSTVEGDWTIHQMMTTSNFAPNNLVLSWFVGGLNYQVEHHLFPNMSHVHHREVSKIVRKTAKEYNVPYHSKKTFIGALVCHAKMLHSLRK